MMAMLWYIQIVNELATFADVPRLLKPKVRELLILAGNGDLIPEE